MAKLLITTQTYENYGSAAEPYWKPKGGSDYVVKKFKGGEEAATMAVMGLRGQIECDNEGYREHILGWEIVGDKHLTEFEQSQLDYEGQIRYPAKELMW
jgi:hypothetical protein